MWLCWVFHSRCQLELKTFQDSTGKVSLHETVGKIPFAVGCRPVATFSFLPRGPLCRATHNGVIKAGREKSQKRQH